ncbi:Glycerol kinase [Streptomyces tanashiensis]
MWSNSRRRVDFGAGRWRRASSRLKERRPVLRLSSRAPWRRRRSAPADVKAIGITNQRETTLLWDENTGEPVHNALVWQDTRTDALCKELGRNVGQDRFRRETGLPLASYFSGPKVRWLLDNVEGLRERAERGDILFGTMDSWVIWNLTGGVDGGRHVTDVTNASRTMLMNLHTMSWDEKILQSMEIPAAVLPEIRSSAEVYGTVKGGILDGVPVASALGDQQAALFGQTCFAEGEAKSTYGTGTFMLMNTGRQDHQLLQRPADHGRLPDRRREAGLRPGGLDRRHRFAGAVDARRDGPSQSGAARAAPREGGGA